MAAKRIGADAFREQFPRERDSSEIYSMFDFQIHMSVSEKSNGLRCFDEGRFKVFWYDLEQLTPVRRTLPSAATLGRSTRIQDRVTSALISGQPSYSTTKLLLQFWAPIKTKTGETKLTLSEQPFALGELYKGLCRLKYHYLQQENEEDHGQNGPPARVFKRGLPEYCPGIEHYSTQEFPSRDYARECGIDDYWAQPLFESDSSQHCLGVLECFSMGCYDDGDLVYRLQVQLEELGLRFGEPHDDLLEEMESGMLCQWDEVELEKALEVVREAHQLPLILVWIPNQKSFSKASISLCCIMTIYDYGEFEISAYGDCCAWSFVKSGEGLVGSAYSENRPCFSSDATQLSTSDRPFAHCARSAGLTACFVIPLKLVYPKLDHLFFEMFLPPDGTCTNGNSEAVLKSLCSTVALAFSKINVAVGLEQDEEFLAKFSHFGGEELNLSFFHVKRITKGDAENTCSIESLPNDPNAQETTAEEPVHLDSQNAQATDTELVNLDELQQYPNAHDASDSSGEVIATMAEDQITLAVLKPYFGNTIDAAAEHLGVSRSTLKRRCRALGIDRWPWHKRHKVTGIQSSPRLKQSQTQKNTTKKKAPHSQFQTKINATDKEVAADSVPSSSNRDSTHQNYDMIGKASYGGDTVMFPLKSNAGIKELHKELNQRFQLQADKFKIKYKYEEEWILIICDQDLNFGMEMIKSTGEKTINLSICPLSTS